MSVASPGATARVESIGTPGKPGAKLRFEQAGAGNGFATGSSGKGRIPVSDVVLLPPGW